MHEFSLACNILEIVEENVRKQNASQVTELTLEIGSMAGVELHALQIALQSLQENSVLNGTKINYSQIPAKAQCPHCRFEFEPEDLISPCPNCNGFGIKVLTGKELIVKSMVIE